MPASGTFDEYARGDATALLRLAVLLTGDRDDADDLVQECLARVLSAWRRRPPDDPHGYARRALVNLARDRWRRHRRSPVVVPLRGDEGAAVTPHAALVERQAMLGALAQLPPRQRAVLVLRFYEGLTEPRIAELLDCSVSSVKTHAARGLDRLRPLVAAATTTGETR